MTVEQIYSLMNDVVDEITGVSDLVQEDLQNVVQIGEAVLNATSYDNYVRTLVNHIGKVDYHNRRYTGGAPSVYKDSWEYGSIREKISFEMPDSENNPSWDLVDGNTYNQDKFTKPVVNVTFFNGLDTYQIPLSITERQVKESFSSVAQLNGFISGLQIAVENAITLRNDELIMRTINNMTALTITKGGKSYVKLLTAYNQTHGTQLTADEAIINGDFIRWANFKMNKVVGKLSKMSTLYNIAGKKRFTPSDKLHIVTLDEYDAACGSFLYDANGQFTSENLKLPKHSSVACWQGNGQDDMLDSTSKIDVVVDATPAGGSTNTSVQKNYIIAVMFDDLALGVTNENRRTTSHQNAVGEFTNYWYKVDAQYFNDVAENFVVFTLE